MFFGLNCSLVAGVVTLSGLGSYFCLRTQCSLTKSSFFWKRSLNTEESILECEGNGKKYSVFLAFNNSGENQQDPSFKVIDHKVGGKVVWGPESNPDDKWSDWGIAVYKDKGVGEEKSEMRVPARGNIYRKGGGRTPVIPCQKSLLKVKTDTTGACSKGGIVMSGNMKFTIDKNNVQVTNSKFEWSDGFQPKEIFCAS